MKLLFKRLSTFCFISFLLSCMSFSANSFAQVMSDKALYANGHKYFNERNWQYASIYLFAYQQRNPEALANDPNFQKELTKAFDHCMASLSDDLTDLKKCNAEVASLKRKLGNGVGSFTQGLETPPPVLRPPSKVGLAATTPVQDKAVKTNNAIKLTKPQAAKKAN